MIAVVTGASKGIGAAIAKRLAADGASVVVNYASSREGADKACSEIEAAGGRSIAVRADVARKADVDQLFAATKEAFGRLDILVNNAGVYQFAALEDFTEAEFHKHFDLNVLGVLLTSQAAVKLMQGSGSIINISSLVSTVGIPGSAVYSGTKGAVDAITRVLAKELGARGIRVNSINPGMVETEGTQAGGITEGDMRKQIEAQTPLGRIGQPNDIAGIAAFLASSDSSWITGESFIVAGGWR
jgi:3-oxoacyl-[acyl-carrier protein] reductase